jgi:hypothetical protein
MMSTCCSKHVEAWNKYIKKECVKLVINQNYQTFIRLIVDIDKIRKFEVITDKNKEYVLKYWFIQTNKAKRRQL